VNQDGGLHMSDAEATFYDIGHGIAETDASQMFGKKCFKVCKGGKPFVSFERVYGL
jgi:hypothetical protein